MHCSSCGLGQGATLLRWRRTHLRKSHPVQARTIFHTFFDAPSSVNLKVNSSATQAKLQINKEPSSTNKLLQVVQLPSTVVCLQDGVFRRSYVLRTVLAPRCKHFGMCVFEECCSSVQMGTQGDVANQLAPQAQFRPRAFEKCSALRQISFEKTEYDPANLTRCLPECCFLEAGIVSLHLQRISIG